MTPSMQVVEVPSAVVDRDLRRVNPNETLPVMRLITGVGAIIVMSGSWAGDINVPTVLLSPSLSIS
jgi:hypothetical protein